MAKKRILLVDDECDILRATELRLSAAGFEIATARDGEEAVASVMHSQPDAIVMDVRMPRMDGLTALTKLQQDSETQHISIVMLSASLSDQERALDAGATCFLHKPYNGKELVEALKAVIGRAEQGRNQLNARLPLEKCSHEAHR